MNTIIQQFFTPKWNMTKRLLIVALFGSFALGSTLFTGGRILLVPVAHADGGTISGIISSVTVSDPAPHVGETITYTFNVDVLNGNVATSTDVAIATGTLPSGLTFASSTGTDFGMFSGAWNASSTSFTITATVNTNATGTITYIPANIEYVDGSCDINSLAYSVGGAAASSSVQTGSGSDCDAASLAISGNLPQIVVTSSSADLSITKSVNKKSAKVGDEVDYTITVKNRSTSATSTDVVASDVLPSGLTFESATTTVGTSTYATSTDTETWTIGALAPKATATLDIEAMVNASASSTLWNTATVSASTTDPDTSNNSSSVSICVHPAPTSTPSADISIVKMVNPTSTTVGSTTTVDYTIAVTNNSTSTAATGAVATDVLPSGLTFESATTTVGTSTYATSTDTETWTIGTLTPSSTATLNLTALVDTSASSTISNTATVSAGTTDPNTANNSSTVLFFVTQASSTPTSTPSADLSISKTVDDNNPSVGDTVNYTITVANNSTSTAATGTVATDVLPSGLTFESATTTVGTSTYATSTDTETWTIGTLTPSSTATLTVAALVDSGTAGDTILNTATISASTTDPKTANNSSTVSIDVAGGGGCSGSCGSPEADLTISKTADVTSTIPGGIINYTITVANNSTSTTSTGVVASDTLPSGLTFESATTTVGTSTYATSTDTETWTIGTLTPSSTATLDIQALVNASTTDSTITNTATVVESPALVNLGNNSSTISIPVVYPTSTGSGLTILKTVDNTNPVAGADVNYTIAVANSGSATSTFVDVQDALPTSLSIVSSTISQGSSTDAGAFDWSVGTLAPNATATLVLDVAVGGNQAGQSITNTATIFSQLDPSLTASSSVTLNVQPAACTSNCGGGGGGGGGGGNTPSAEIGIVKTVDNADPASGSAIHYTLTVSATGPSESFNVVAHDVLPAGVSFVSATSSEGSYNSSTGVWTIGDIAVGQTKTLVITATVTAPNGTTITNTGTVSESPTVVDPRSGNNSSSVIIDVGGQVLGASTSTVATSTGQVLGASCGLYLTSYIHPGRKNLNDSTEVKKLQTFLNQNLGLDLPITGYYGSSTIAAVDQFQVKYHSEVLHPWLSLGLPTEYTPTGYVYQSTQRWINLIMCPPLNLPLPALKVDNGE